MSTAPDTLLDRKRFGFETKAEVLERVEAFVKSNHSLEAAADFGLLALGIPPTFGGIPTFDIRPWGYLLACGVPQILVATLEAHFNACQRILVEGTYSQLDFYLPQLAAGKRIGLTMLGRIRFRITDEGVPLLWGQPTTDAPLRPDHLVVIGATSPDKEKRFIILRADELPSGTIARGQRTALRLSAFKIEPSAFLGGVIREVRDTSVWRAMRWTTAQSAS